MAQVVLMDYLQRGLTQYNIDPALLQSSHPNTRNNAYSARDIQGVTDWPGFNLNAVPPLLLNVLQHTGIPPDLQVGTPPRMITAEGILKHDLGHTLTPPLRRSLRHSFNFLRQTNQMAGLSILSFGVGEESLTPGRFLPDTAYFELNIQPQKGPNRAPGDIKPSWKWNRAMQHAQSATDRFEFNQVLSQVNYYMRQHRARYGFVITDQSFTAIRRTQREGHLELSAEIPLQRRGTAQQPQWTVLLAMWYLGMLVAADNQWQL